MCLCFHCGGVAIFAINSHHHTVIYQHHHLMLPFLLWIDTWENCKLRKNHFYHYQKKNILLVVVRRHHICNPLTSSHIDTHTSSPNVTTFILNCYLRVLKLEGLMLSSQSKEDYFIGDVVLCLCFHCGGVTIFAIHPHHNTVIHPYHHPMLPLLLWIAT